MTTAPAPLFDPELRVDLIDANPDNPRKDLGDLSELADSIREQGILEPLVVEPVDDTSNRVILLAGHRRLAAAIQAGAETVPALVHAHPSSRHVRVERMLTENLQRADLTLVEEGDAYQLLLDLPDANLTPAKLAKRLGKSVKHVQQTVKAAGLPESTRERLIRGQINLEDAARIEQFAKNPEALKRINRAAEAGPVALDRALAEAKDEADLAKERARRKRELRKDGRTVVDVGTDEWDEATYVAGVYPPIAYDDERLVGVTGYYEREQKKSSIQEEQHFAEHPAAHIVAVTVDVGWVVVNAKCTAPDWHDQQHIESPEEKAAREAEEAAAAEAARLDGERRQKLAAAAVARRHYLGKVASSDAADDLAHQIALAAFEPLFVTSGQPHKEAELRAFAHVVLPNLPDATLADVKALTKRVRAALTGMRPAELVVLNDVRLNLSRDEQLTRTDRYTWAQGFGRAWYKRLRDFYGYEPAPIEAELYALHNPADDKAEA